VANVPFAAKERFYIVEGTAMSAADPALLEAAKTHLFTAVISDTLDGLGLRDQALSPRLRPLDESLVLFGRARTGQYTEVFECPPDDRNPYELEIKLIDDLAAGEVAVLACGESQRIVPWGELLTTAAKARGGAGCVTDGMVRDTRLVRALAFPVFHGGIAPLDSKGRGEITAIDVAVMCGGVRIESGDLIFGDCDGVVAIPRAVERVVLERALEKVRAESVTRRELEAGAKLGEVFARYGVL